MTKNHFNKTKKRVKRAYPAVIALILTFLCFAGITLVANRDLLTVKTVLVQLGALCVLVGSVGVYMVFADRELATNVRKILTLCFTMLVSYCLLWATNAIVSDLSAAPFAFCALMISLLISNRTGFFANFVVILIYFLQGICFEPNASYNDQNFYLLFAGVITAVYASYVLGKHYRRLSYIIVGGTLGLIASVCRIISYFMFATGFDAGVFASEVALAFVSGLITIMLMFLLLPIWERIFNVVSPFRFSEIANSSTKLMRLMFEKAPGTYNHSLTVANYVEACATAIGENPFLARAISYYHDIGKMKNPYYFSENQTDEVNPHDSLTPEASVNVIKTHVAYGLQLSKEYDLPIEVHHAIAEHHGTMPMKFFYLKAKKYTDGELPYDDYSYDGPKPTSKIAAILMICDACEAALRAAGSDSTKAEAIVDSIVEERMRFDQFSDCDITMKELDIVKSTIITTFLGIKHKRVKYPEVKL